jgi:hypothetical protein
MLPQERINQYIADQEEWKRPLLVRLRQLIHQADDRIEENWRWNGPHFDREGIMLGMAAFKHFVSVWFHKGALLKDRKGLFEKLPKDKEKSNRVYKVKQGEDIREEAFLDLVQQAVDLNLSGAKLSDAAPARKRLVVPGGMLAVLKKDEAAWAHWKRFSASHKREFVEWITDARQEETRKRRLAQALEMIRAGESRHDRYRSKGSGDGA